MGNKDEKEKKVDGKREKEEIKKDEKKKNRKENEQTEYFFSPNPCYILNCGGLDNEWNNVSVGRGTSLGRRMDDVKTVGDK